MNLADWVIVASVVISALVGIYRGFVREILSLISWIVAIWAAFTFANSGSVYFEPYLDQPELRTAASFAAIFVVVLLVLSIISYLLHRLLSISGIAGTDRALGGIFGIARAVALVALFLLLARLTGYPQETWWKQSLLIQQLQPLVEIFHQLLPLDIAKHLKSV